MQERAITTHARSLLPLVRRGVRRWLARRAFAEDVHGPLASASTVHTRARAALGHTLAQLTTNQRITVRERVQAAYRMIEGVRGVGAEHALLEWLSTRPQQEAVEWLDAWRHSALLRTSPEAAEHAFVTTQDWQIAAVVMLLPVA